MRLLTCIHEVMSARGVLHDEVTTSGTQAVCKIRTRGRLALVQPTATVALQ